MAPYMIFALRNLSTLTSNQRTVLMDSIAKTMTTIMIITSQEIENGNLDANNTAPMHMFIRIILDHDRAYHLQRKVKRDQRRARRAERRRIQSEFAEKPSKGSKA
ncbi:hypothetical protein BDW74DRAFT_175118 [Aspergillus multicolor]|uniref:uncharacterized protein n=1 Tax=Aspergillus multicolor TaxID=41759 RepID=UPI003CCD142E